jgi:hypothetical protein
LERSEFKTVEKSVLQKRNRLLESSNIYLLSV